MEVRRFEFLKDYIDFKDWIEHRNESAPSYKYLPQNGYVVEDGQEKVVMGFIYKTECNGALFDYFVSNPKSEKGIRRESLNAMVHYMLKDAKKMNIEHVTAITDIPRVAELSKQHGFTQKFKNMDIYGRVL